ncbi:MAG: CDP-alcohol phosphatidyltransferase family protein [candidate division Zixibacteria bacterium]|nr:CDP-alcohol phosphatidyltransferase family protein [candidate division Zixibacteria bacterium]MBU1469578.1 CDP-alcohol phosphatidyltransferase family protein [candidate division Zixibacteria bacterium]
MVAGITWPNIVTVTRLSMVFLLVMLAYGDSIWSRLLAALVAVLVIIGDWLDGHLARKLHQSTTLGSVLDVAADRIIENVLWIILADLDLVPIWIPVIVISRGILTDSIRGYALSLGYSGFGKKTMMKSRIGRFITGSPIMRTSYAILKAFSYGWLLLFAVLDEVLVRWPVVATAWVGTGLAIGYWCAIVATIVCIVRGIPVVVEGFKLIQGEGAHA